MDWTSERWKSIIRDYTQKDVAKIRGSLQIKYTIAEVGCQRLWHLLNTQFVPALGALTGHQACQMVKAGLKAIYLSGWQVAADGNTGLQTYPDQSLYPVDSVPRVVERINNAFQRMDQIDTLNGVSDTYWYAPIVADAEAGFGGNLNAYELMQAMIKAGASAVHFEDQLASAKKCGHMGGRVIIDRKGFIEKLKAARLAADVLGVDTLIIARTDSLGAQLLTSDIDETDRQFCTGERTPEGFYVVRCGLEVAISRGLAYAPYADMIWFETSEPNVEQAELFAKAIHKVYPGKKLAYNCSPSFHWKKKLDDESISCFQADLAKMGYVFQFVTLAGWHVLNYSMFHLASDYLKRGMTAYSKVQQLEFEAEKDGYGATKHQAFVGTGYFDHIAKMISHESSTTAMNGSTEKEQF